jgi:hypothetical protein
MAIARCENCGGPERTKNFECVFVSEPLNYPDPNIRCSKKGCSNPAKIWLHVMDAMAYRNSGQRIFVLPFHPARRVTLKDDGRFVSKEGEPDLKNPRFWPAGRRSSPPVRAARSMNPAVRAATSYSRTAVPILAALHDMTPFGRQCWRRFQMFSNIPTNDGSSIRFGGVKLPASGRR